MAIIEQDNKSQREVEITEWLTLKELKIPSLYATWEGLKNDVEGAL